MEKQLIISIGREFGSGGHEIAEILAKHYGLNLYDKNLLQEIANEKSVEVKNLEKYDEVPRNLFMTRTVKGYSNSAEENLANMQFDYLRKKAESGESFVVVGRCSEDVLKKYPGTISIFILGDWESKVDRVVRIYGMNRDEAETLWSVRIRSGRIITIITVRVNGVIPVIMMYLLTAVSLEKM